MTPSDKLGIHYKQENPPFISFSDFIPPIMHGNHWTLPGCCVLLLLLLLTTSIQTSYAFAPIHSNTLLCNRKSLHLSQKGVGDFDDFEFEDLASSKELATEFYQQVRQRERNRIKQGIDMIHSNEEPTGENSGRKRMRNRGDIDSTGTPSAGLFAREYGSVYSFPVERQPRALNENSQSSSAKQILRSEFWDILKVSSHEITLLIQGILVLGSLVILIYIGITGGITDGSDRFGGMDEMIREFRGFDNIIDLNLGIHDGPVSESTGVWL